MVLGVTDRQMHCPKISIVGRHFGWSDIGSRKENTLYFALAYVPFAACTRSQAQGPPSSSPPSRVRMRMCARGDLGHQIMHVVLPEDLGLCGRDEEGVSRVGVVSGFATLSP